MTIAPVSPSVSGGTGKRPSSYALQWLTSTSEVILASLTLCVSERRKPSSSFTLVSVFSSKDGIHNYFFLTSDSTYSDVRVASTESNSLADCDW